MNFKVGFIRLAIASTSIAFFIGSYVAYVPDWASTDYKEITNGIKIELTNSECLKGRLTYWEEVEYPQKGTYEVALPKIENSKLFLSADCPNLKKYAAILGRVFLWKNKVNVADLSFEKIEIDLIKRRNDEILSHIIIRLKNGFTYGCYVLGIITFIGLLFLITKWVISGFRKSN